jgi:LPS-assembly protein
MIKLVLIFFLTILGFAENIEVFGLKTISQNNIVTVIEGTFIKNDIVLSANKIIYDKNKNIIIAKGNVYVNYNKNSVITGQYAYIDLTTKNIKITPFFMFNFDDLTWISGKKMTQKNEVYNLDNMITSTCNPSSPDWKIISSSSMYNKKTKWIDLYNPTLYVKNIPILYLPYLGFSTDKTRRSGFLRPIFGFSGSEGFLFTQPYYQVLGDAADLEIDPTIRTKRGTGIYSTFRFVHSTTSKGEFKIGTFSDKRKYQEQYKLENKTHNGWSFLYTNRNLMYNDKLYMNIKNAGDTDYFYLDPANKFNTSYLSDKIITSNINYYTIYKNNYFGLYGKYFKDTTKDDNSDTMQLLPQFQYHKFSTNPFDKFLYSADFNIYNYTRKTGYKAVKKTVFIPLGYQINMFDNYLRFNIKENFNYAQVNQKGDNQDLVAKYYTNDTNLKLYSLLSKSYKIFSHSIIPSISYSFNNKYYKNNSDSDYLGDYKVKKNMKFSLEQYLLSKDITIYHSLSQVYYLDNNETNRLSDLFNTLKITYNNFYFNDRTKYSYDIHQIKYDSFTLGYDNKIYKLEGRYTYNYKQSKSYDINGYYKFDKTHKLFADYNYDLKLKMQKYWLLGISMRKQCWNYSVSFKRKITPILTTDGVSGIIRKTIYFEVEFIPLGGIKQQYQFKTKKAD